MQVRRGSTVGRHESTSRPAKVECIGILGAYDVEAARVIAGWMEARRSFVRLSSPCSPSIYAAILAQLGPYESISCKRISTNLLCKYP